MAWTAARPRLAAPGSPLMGVYVGCMYHEYLGLLGAAAQGAAAKLPAQAFVGNGAPYMVGRLSYSFGFTGACVLVAGWVG